MNKFYTIITATACAAMLAGCGGSDGGKKFRPAEKESAMTAEERSAAINQARNTANGSLNDIMAMRSVKLSVLSPKPVGDITQQQADEIGARLINIVAKNGISGLGTCPTFALGVTISEAGRETTGTAPQKMVVKYDLVYEVVNTITDDVYASATQSITGAGKSYADATRNAIRSLKSNPQIQSMLSTASKRIIDWYENQLPSLKNQVEAAASSGDYALALALVSSVPQEATTAFEWATEQQPVLFDRLKDKMAADNLAAMTAAIASANGEFNPEIGGYFALIPADSPQYAQAQAAYTEYMTRVEAHMAALEVKAASDSVSAREFRRLSMEYADRERLAQINADKVVGKAQARASAQAGRDYEKKGFFSRLGDRIIDGIDAISSGDLFSSDDD